MRTEKTKVKYLEIVNKIYSKLSTRRKYIILFFFILSFIGAFTEIASISAIIPFIDLILSPEKVQNYFSKYNIPLTKTFFDENSYQLLIRIVFISIIILSSLIKFFLGYLGHLISNNITHEMNTTLFKNLMTTNSLFNQPCEK